MVVGAQDAKRHGFAAAVALLETNGGLLVSDPRLEAVKLVMLEFQIRFEWYHFCIAVARACLVRLTRDKWTAVWDFLAGNNHK